MGPTLGPPVDRYARRRAAGKDFANAITGFFGKQAEKEAERIENEAFEKEGLSLEGKKGKAREFAIKSHHEGKLKKEEIGEKLKAEKGFDEYKRQKENEEDFMQIADAVDHSEESPFNFKNPSSWKNSQIEKLRAIQAKTPKAKSLVQQAQQEYDKRENFKKIREKTSPLMGALQTIHDMEALGEKGNLGIGTSLQQIYSPEARNDAAQYEQLGKSLISLASTIPIRNQAEFETLSGKLFDPSVSDSGRKGILNAMKRIIQNSLEAYSSLAPEESRKEFSNQERPPLTSFDR